MFHVQPINQTIPPNQQQSFVVDVMPNGAKIQRDSAKRVQYMASFRESHGNRGLPKLVQLFTGDELTSHGECEVHVLSD